MESRFIIQKRQLNGLLINMFRLCLLAFIFMSMSAFSISAAKTYSLQMKNVEFVQAVKEIERLTEYTFVYNVKIVDADAKVTLNVQNGRIQDVLNQLVRKQPITYEIKGSRIYLLTRENVKSKSNSSGNKVIVGKVTDENGEPLVGATISIPGENIYAVSDVDGNYRMLLPENCVAKVVQVSYVGFVTSKRKITDSGELDFEMTSSVQNLEDLVVVGYGTQKRESLTSAISTLDSEDLSRSAATTTSGALVGKVAGVNSRMSDGRPGAWTTLNIRNMGTPLYVVDGVQMDEGQFNNIDFNDIENISVLKDASASIYGVRAANGVVVVTTKSGKRNTANRVNVNTYYGWQEMMRFPRPADAATWVGALVQSATIQNKVGKYTYDDYLKWKQGTEKGYVPFDWYDYIFTTAPQFYVSANTSGGSDKINYYVAMSHLRQEAIINNYGNFNRTNMQVNLDANITSNFKLGVSVNGRLENKVHPAISGNDGNDDYWTAFFATYRNLPTLHPYANDNPLYPQQTSTAYYTNFALFGQTGEQLDRWKVLQTTLNAEWEVLKGLKIKGIFSYYYANRRYDNQEHSYKLYSYNDKTDTYAVASDIQSRWKERVITNIENVNTQLSATYDTKIKDEHHIAAFVGIESYKYSSPGFSITSNPLANSLDLIYADDIKSFNDAGDNTQTRLGFMGKINYDYNSKYLLELQARYDGSWKFPPNHRWGFFPSVSAGWRVIEEDFWSDDFKDIMSNLKLRVSYGLMGDDNVYGYGSFDYLGGYNYGNGGAVLDGDWVVGSSTRTLPVTNMSWIKSKIIDVGVDLGFLNNRLTGTLDVFRRIRTGLPAARYDKVLPSEIGFTLPNENLNSDMQQGLDGNIVWQDKIGELSYRVGGNFTFSRSYNWHQYKPRFGNSREYYVYSANERVAGASWTLECIGQFQSWEQIANWPVDIDGKGNTTLRPGDLIYADKNGDQKITDEDQFPAGYQSYESGNTPVINFGLNLGLSWRGIDFSADFTGAAMQSFWFNYEQRTPFWGDANSPLYMLEDQWHLADITDPNSELIPGKYPTALDGNSSHSNYTASTFWMRNVRYLKLRNLELGYTFPQKWTKKLSIQNLRIYTLMQNLFSIDNVHDRGIDPEICQSAGFAYPTNRVINFGLNVTF